MTTLFWIIIAYGVGFLVGRAYTLFRIRQVLPP